MYIIMTICKYKIIFLQYWLVGRLLPLNYPKYGK
jgi:hypothetical protein